MLHIKRKVGQKIRIDDVVTAEVLSVSPTYVKLGFVFPDGNSVWREEKYEEVKAAKSKAECNYDNDAEQHFNSEEEYVKG